MPSKEHLELRAMIRGLNGEKNSHLELSTPELAQGLVYRLVSVHGLRGAALLSQARKILKAELANLESLESLGKVKR